MSGTKARQIVLAARPQGKPRLTDFGRKKGDGTNIDYCPMFRPDGRSDPPGEPWPPPAATRRT